MQTKVSCLLLISTLVIAEGQSLCANTNGIAMVFPKKNELADNRDVRLDAIVMDLCRYNAIWCSQLVAKYNPQAWKIINNNHSEKLLLRYISGCSTYPNSSLVCLNYNYINKAHPEWFLLADARTSSELDYKIENKRIRWNAKDKKHTYYNRFYLDVANKDFQEWAAQEILSIVKGDVEGLGIAYDGVAIDNVYLGNILHERFKFQYPHWRYAQDIDSWSNGYAEYIRKVKEVLNANGFVVVINYNPLGDNRGEDENIWQMIYRSANGVLTERALRSGWQNRNYFTGDRWLAAITRHEEILDEGLINWWACTPIENHIIDRETFLYTYCSWLLIKNHDRAFYSIDVSAADQLSDWTIAYDLPIGEPVSARYLRGSCWMRNFRNATIVVNPTKEPQRIEIGGEGRWLNWSDEKAAKSFVMPAQTGRIFVPVANDSEP